MVAAAGVYVCGLVRSHQVDRALRGGHPVHGGPVVAVTAVLALVSVAAGASAVLTA